MIQPTVSSHIDVHLIEKALALTGKTMENMKEDEVFSITTSRPTRIGDSKLYDSVGLDTVFSIEKFGWYLLSPEFIEKYAERNDSELSFGIILQFGKAIYEYQKGNPEPLIGLLEKI